MSNSINVEIFEKLYKNFYGVVCPINLENKTNDQLVVFIRAVGLKKICSRCQGEEKDIIKNFPLNLVSGKNGFSYICKTCINNANNIKRGFENRPRVDNKIITKKDINRIVLYKGEKGYIEDFGDNYIDVVFNNNLGLKNIASDRMRPEELTFL